jgi:tetratricopeptide (TPR) repeat protein
MTAPARFIMLVVGMVSVGAVFMTPRLDEWLAIMRDEDKQAQIIALLEPRLAQGKVDPGLLATLGRSYAEIGNYQRATELLLRYAALRPGDADAYARLADLYKAAGDVNRQMAMLERHIAIAPTPSRAMQLAVLYRQEDQADAELALLSRFENQLTVESGLLLRLAERLAGTGNRDRAIRVLTRSEGASGPARNDRERLFWAELLVQSGRSAEAVRLGRHWIVQWHEAWLADRLLRIFAVNAPVGDASELADAVAVLHPEVRFFLVHELATMGARSVARHLLESWVTANPSPSMDEIAGFLTACREQDAPAIVWQAFGEVLRHPSSDDVLIRYGEAIAAEFGIGALAPFWASLPGAVIQRRSLLAVRLAFYEHDPAMTKRLLQRVDLAALGTPDRQLWMGLLTAVTSPPEAFEVLRGQRRSGGLPRDLLPGYARLAGGLGQEIEYRLALTDMKREVH